MYSGIFNKIFKIKKYPKLVGFFPVRLPSEHYKNAEKNKYLLQLENNTTTIE
jgi:hypothetical protein